MITLDEGHHLPTFIVCDFCKNIIEKKKTCKAFPFGIPKEVIEGKNEHGTPIKGQTGGYVYEPINDKVK